MYICLILILLGSAWFVGTQPDSNPGQVKTTKNGTTNGTSEMAMRVDTTTEEEEIPEKTPIRPLLLHTILVTLAFVIFVPTSVLVARFLKDSFTDTIFIKYRLWFVFHFTTGFVSITLVIASVVVAFLYWGIFSRGEQKVIFHYGIGMAAVLFFVITISTGGYLLFTDEISGTAIGTFHTICGYAVLVTGLTQIHMSFYLVPVHWCTHMEVSVLGVAALFLIFFLSLTYNVYRGDIKLQNNVKDQLREARKSRMELDYGARNDKDNTGRVDNASISTAAHQKKKSSGTPPNSHRNTTVDESGQKVKFSNSDQKDIKKFQEAKKLKDNKKGNKKPSKEDKIKENKKNSVNPEEKGKDKDSSKRTKTRTSSKADDKDSIISDKGKSKGKSKRKSAGGARNSKIKPKTVTRSSKVSSNNSAEAIDKEKDNPADNHLRTSVYAIPDHFFLLQSMPAGNKCRCLQEFPLKSQPFHDDPHAKWIALALLGFLLTASCFAAGIIFMLNFPHVTKPQRYSCFYQHNLTV